MGLITMNGKAWKRITGFTLVELMVVLTLLSLLASLVTPVMLRSIQSAKESALKENLLVMRKAIDDYYADKGHYPEKLSILASEKYIRSIPEDPLTKSHETWVEVSAENEEGISDIHSGAVSQSNINYKEW